VKALLALIMMLGLVYLASRIAQEPVTPDSDELATDKRLEVVSFHCEKKSAKYSAEIRVRNVSDSEVSGLKGFIQFNPKGRLPFVDSTDILPGTLPANAIGKASLISRDNDGRSYDCSVLRIEDSSGIRVD